MKKTIKWLLILTILFNLVNCGSNSNKEAKELLQKILQIVGIPYDIIVNVCQDDNNNGFCEKIELQSKINISAIGDETFWQKIEQSSEDRYFLETYDYTKPILLELQDVNRVDFNNGKFTITFGGFESKKQKEIKELSVLQAMIDAEHLKKIDVQGLKNLNTPYAQDKFYEYLFDGLETNLNTLAQKGFSPNEAISINIERMAKQMLENNITTNLPKNIAECNDKECIDKELTVLSSILKIKDRKIEDKRIIQ